MPQARYTFDDEQESAGRYTFDDEQKSASRYTFDDEEESGTPSWAKTIGGVLAETPTRFSNIFQGLKTDIGLLLHETEVNKYLHPVDSYINKSNSLVNELKNDPTNEDTRGAIQAFGVDPDELLSDDFDE